MRSLDDVEVLGLVLVGTIRCSLLWGPLPFLTALKHHCGSS